MNLLFIMVRNKSKYFVSAILVLMTSYGFSQQLNKTNITVHADNLPLETVLDEIELASGYVFSYPTEILEVDKPTTLHKNNASLDEVLQPILGNNLRYKERGSYIIIQEKRKSKSEKKRYEFSGQLIDAKSGNSISNASIYEVNGSKVSLSSKNGDYALNVKDKSDYIEVLVSKENYRDTLLRLRQEEVKNLVIKLQPLDSNLLQSERSSAIDTQVLVQILVSDRAYLHTSNLLLEDKKLGQFSFLPSLGTNGSMSGKTSNVFSFNLLAGYAHSLNGIEFGGIANVERYHVRGLQFAGVSNLVGGRTLGIQIAGFSNLNKMDVRGIQFAGFMNTSKRRFIGAQAAGFINIAPNAHGLQVAGFMNSAWVNSHAFQVAGFMNLSSQNDGAQVAGFMNISLKKIRGAQVAGFLNTASRVTGGQFAGFMNFSTKEVIGGQIAGIFNIGNRVTGGQIGLINICDTLESGVSIGLLNFIRSGIHDLQLHTSDVMPANLLFKTGTNYFYNILALGYHFDLPIYSVGYGIGSRKKFKSGFMTGAEVQANLVLTEKKEDGPLNVLGHFVPYFGMNWGEITLTGGPVLNVYYSQFNPDSQTYGHPILNNAFYDETTIDGNVKMSIGYRVGIAF